MKWVTWQDVRVDRIGCAWLIRRFVDPDAEFLFVPVGQRPRPEDAAPFDIPGVRLSHHDGHASFHAFVRAYDLADPALHRVARIVDEADTVQEAALEPAAAEFDRLAAARGLVGTAVDRPWRELVPRFYPDADLGAAASAGGADGVRMGTAHARRSAPLSGAVVRRQLEGGLLGR